MVRHTIALSCSEVTMRATPTGDTHARTDQRELLDRVGDEGFSLS
jgi:hypothetical protein